MWQCRSPRRSSTRDQVGERPRRRGLQLPAPLAQLGRDPRQAEPLVDLLLGRAAQRLAGGVVEDPVLRDVQPAPHGRLAQRHVVRLRAGEVLEHVAELVGRDDLEVDGHARVEHDARAGLAGLRPTVSTSSWPVSAATSAGGSAVVATMSRSLTASALRRSEPATSTRSAPGAARRASTSCSAIGSARDSSQRGAGRAVVAGGERLEQLLLGLRAEPAQAAQLLGLGRGAQLLERVDPELVV